MIDEWSIEFTTMLGVDVSVNCQLESEFHCGSRGGLRVVSGTLAEDALRQATNWHEFLLRRAAAVDPLMRSAANCTLRNASQCVRRARSAVSRMPVSAAAPRVVCHCFTGLPTVEASSRVESRTAPSARVWNAGTETGMSAGMIAGGAGRLNLRSLTCKNSVFGINLRRS